MSLVASHSHVPRRSRIVEEGVRNLVIQSANFICCEARGSALRQEAEITESAEVEVRAFLADVSCIEEHFAGELLLKPETPGLFIGNVVADLFDRANGVEPNVIECAQRASGGRCNPAVRRIAKRTRCILQRVI